MKHLTTSFKELHLNNADKTEINKQLGVLCFLRGEEIDDYDFEVWLDYWATNGYTKTQVLEMIELGKRLPKYGTVKLAIGDLITNWEKNFDKQNNISWQVFLDCLNIFLKKDKDLLNKLSLELLGVEFIKNEDRNKAYNYMLWIISQIQSEVSAVEHENSLIAKQATINVFEKIKQDTRLDEKAYYFIKTEIIGMLNSVKNYFLDKCVSQNKVYVTRVSDGAKIPAKDQNGKDIIEGKYNGAKMLIYIDNEIERLKKEIKNFKK